MRDPNDNRNTPAAAAAAAVKQTAAAMKAARVSDIPARPQPQARAQIGLTVPISTALKMADERAQPSAPAATGAPSAAPTGPAQQYSTPNFQVQTAAPGWTFLEKLRAQVMRPDFIRRVLAPLVWEMFGYFDQNPAERKKRLTLALLVLLEKGDDWVATNFPLTDYRAVVKMAVDNPLTDALEARLTEAAAVVIGDAIERAYSAVKPVFDWLRAALGK